MQPALRASEALNFGPIDALCRAATVAEMRKSDRERPMAEQAVSRTHIDNDRVRVTEWNFAPGAATGHHVHEFDYVIVPLESGELLLRGEDGERVATLQAGVPYFRRAGVAHDVANANTCAFRFLEIEIR